ncbi:hypothetical protein HY375_04120 [Candidatus Berkelbacteria bacterium]|nr:hypothetical protein [Candidatus Berkelbacteria bacterium]
MNWLKQRHEWRATTSQLLIGLLVFQASMVSGPATAQASSQAVGSVVLNEVSPSEGWLELYNPGATDVVYAAGSGPLIQTATQQLQLTSFHLAPSGYFVTQLSLDPDQDWVRITTGETVQSIAWGINDAADLPAPTDDDTTVARSVDGAGVWLSNAPESPGQSNAEVIPAEDVPDIPSAVHVPAGDTNALDVISPSVVDDVTLAFTIAEDGYDHLAGLLIDAAGQMSPLERDLANDAEVDGIDARLLAAGSVKILGYAEHDDLVSRWVRGSATLQAMNPVAPPAPTPVAALEAPTNLVATANSNRTVTLRWTDPHDAHIDDFRIFGNSGTTVDLAQAALATVDEAVTSFTTPTLSLGAWSFLVRSVADDGRQSASTPTVTVTIVNPPQTFSLDSTRSLNALEEFGLWVTPSQSLAGDVNLTVRDLGDTLPVGTVPEGVTFAPVFLDLAVDANAAFPLTLRYHYRDAQLTTWNIQEHQWLGVYFYDTTLGQWRPFDQPMVVTKNLTVQGRDYGGYIEASVPHLTPIAFAADVTAPKAPAQLLASAQDGRVKLSWESVKDASGYLVRYRPATNRGDDAYATVFLSGQSFKEFEVANLTNNVLYEFGIAAQDSVGNQGPFAVAEQTPVTTEQPVQTLVLPATPSAATTGAIQLAAVPLTPAPAPSAMGGQVGPMAQSDVEQPAPSATVQAPAPATVDAPAPPPSEAPGDSTPPTGTEDTNRSLVTFLIIVLAAAAGFGGYYGYQWWVSQPEGSSPSDDMPKTQDQPKNERKKHNGRW